MDENSIHSRFEALRRQAEDLLKEQSGKKAESSSMDILSLIHELEVRQMELHIQNEDLRQARREMDEAWRAYAEIYEHAPIGYVTLSVDGLIVKANRMASEMLGTSKEQLAGRAFSTFIDPMDHSGYFELLRNASSRKGTAKTGELRMLRARTVPFHARVEVAPSLDERGQFDSWRIVFGDISDRKRTEEELKVYAEKLERSNRELQEFAFVASHDLQEPLRKIQSFGEIIRKRLTLSQDKEVLDYVERMNNAVGRQQRMVQGLLEFSRVFARGASPVAVDLGEVVQEVLSDLEWQLKKIGAEAVVEELPVIEADPNQMRRLFQNLISNALKYHGKEHPLIKVHGNRSPIIRKEGKYREIFVEDNGIGFAQEDAERIFSLFTRLRGRSEYDGSGMGLAICWRIVERHGGSITARSEPGKGSTFTIILPVSSIGKENSATPS